ncbi:Phosphoserine phosphatase 1 [subsurface metagenome]
MTKVILVRHGETEWNRLRRIQGGNSDTQLNQRGRKQAASLALRLKQEEIQAIYSSPLQRAQDTARAIAGYHQLPVGVEPSLREIEVGELEGVSIAEVGKHLSQLLIRYSQGEELPRIPGGESLTEVQQRVWDTIQRLVGRHGDGVLVVVSHYFSILTAVCSVLNLPLFQIDRLRLNSGSISILTFDEQATRLTLFNDTCHLASIES